MKKTTLLSLCCAFMVQLQAQYLSVTSSTTSFGRYLHTTEARWGTPVLGTRILQGVFANTGTANPTEACSPLNGNTATDVDKIFFIDRSANCSINTQVYHAEQAGATAIVLCDNHGLASPYPLIAPFVSASVSCMAITQTACDSIRLDLQAGNMFFRLSDRPNMAYNLSLREVKVPDNYFIPFCQRRPIDLGCKLRNNGALGQTDISVLVSVTGPQGLIYHEYTVIPGTLAPAPSLGATASAYDVLISAPSFLPTDLGFYQVTYAISNMNGNDEDPGDNIILFQFEITETQYETGAGMLRPGPDLSLVVPSNDKHFCAEYVFAQSDTIQQVRVALNWQLLAANGDFTVANVYKKVSGSLIGIAESPGEYTSPLALDDTWQRITVYDNLTKEEGVHVSAGDTIILELLYYGNTPGVKLSALSGPDHVGFQFGNRVASSFSMLGASGNLIRLTANNAPLRLALGCVTKSSCSALGTGTQALNALFDFTLYPNPAQDQIRVAAQASTESLRCSIFTAMGQQVKAVEITSHDAIDISDLPQGQYYLFCQQGSSFGTKTFSK